MANDSGIAKCLDSLICEINGHKVGRTTGERMNKLRLVLHKTTGMTISKVGICQFIQHHTVGIYHCLAQRLYSSSYFFLFFGLCNACIADYSGKHKNEDYVFEHAWII